MLIALIDHCDPPMRTCSNCGAPVDGPYCSECGQKQATGRFTLRSVLSTALAEMVNLERGAAATVYRLTVAPGSLIRDYWSRRTRPFVSPMRYFLFAVAVYQVVLWQTGAARSIVRGALSGWQDGGEDLQPITSQAEALQAFGEYFLLFFVAGVLILALVSRIGSSRNGAEELIFHLYTWGHLALFWSLSTVMGHAVPIPPALEAVFGWGTLMLTAAYYVWADVSAHRSDTDRPVWRATLEAVGTLFLFVVTYTFLAGTVAGFLIEMFS